VFFSSPPPNKSLANSSRAEPNAGTSADEAVPEIALTSAKERFISCSAIVIVVEQWDNRAKMMIRGTVVNGLNGNNHTAGQCAGLDMAFRMMAMIGLKRKGKE
jgi:hypothetical protein